MTLPRLILIHEPEAACFARLTAGGMAPPRAQEVASYLAQCTDILPRFPALAAECAKRGMAFLPVELDRAPAVLAAADPGRDDLIWTLSDGIAYFRGGVAPALARLYGLRALGADDTLFALCQDKFRSGAVLAALGLPVPQAGLARGGDWLVPPPPAASWFVKPNRLGAKIGIWQDAHVQTLDKALQIGARVHAAYGDDVIVQPYLPGRNARASFLDRDGRGDVADLGVFFADGTGDFQTMAESIGMYGGAGAANRAAGTYRAPDFLPVAPVQPAADATVRRIAAALIARLGLRDVFSMDLRIEADDTVHLVEFEVCPGLPCPDFERYCAAHWGMGLEEAMAATAANRLGLRG